MNPRVMEVLHILGSMSPHAPAKDNSLLERAMQAAYHGRPQQLRAILEEHDAAHPEALTADPVRMLLEVGLRARRGDLAQALDMCNAALALCTEPAQALFRGLLLVEKSVISKQQGHLVKAAALFLEGSKVISRAASADGEAEGDKGSALQRGMAGALLAWQTGREDEARRHLGELKALPLTGEEDEGEIRAVISYLLAAWELEKGDPDVSRAFFEEAIALLKRAEHHPGAATLLSELGDLEVGRARPAAAVPLFKESAALFFDIGYFIDDLHVRNRLVDAHMDARQLADAEACANETLARARKVGHRWAAGHALGQLAKLWQIKGKVPKALARANEALAELEACGDKRRIAVALQSIAKMERDAGRLPDAAAHSQRATELAEAAGDKNGVATCLHEQGAVAVLRKRYDEGIAFFEQARALFDSLGDAGSAAMTKVMLGQARAWTGQWERGLETVADAERTLRALGRPEAPGAAAILRQLEVERRKARGAPAASPWGPKLSDNKKGRGGPS